MPSPSLGEPEVQRPMNSILDLEIIKEIGHKDLVALLQKFPGEKALVWDRALASPVNRIADHLDFKNNGVTKMLALEQGMLPQTDVPETVLFICRPMVQLMPLVASCIRNEEKFDRKKKFHLLFLPKSSFLCETWLQEHGVTRSISSIEDLPLFFFPLDTDVVTMELDGTFKEFHGDLDATNLHHIARALVFFQRRYGDPDHIFCKGQAATHVHELMESIKQENKAPKLTTSGSKIKNLIIFDRQVDLLSPLVTQLTYEGLIDEFYEINNNNVKLPEEKFGDTKTLVLSSAEDLYVELRDKNFSAIGGLLRQKTKDIQEILKQKNKAQSVGEMKRLVQQLPAVNALKQSLTNHTSIAELLKENTESEEFLSSLECEQELLNGIDVDKINPHIEDLCHKKAPITKTLRLLLIQSITSGGFRPKVMQHYERLILQNYGFEHILTLQRLHNVGFLRPQGASRYAVLRRALNLIVCDVSETKPDDFAYVHSIYAPLSIRLIQHRFKPGLWTALKDSLNSLIPGATVDIDNRVKSKNTLGSTSLPTRQPKISVVVFIGGCTFAEISALRFLSKQEDDWQFLVVTTKMINGKNFLNHLSDTLVPASKSPLL